MVHPLQKIILAPSLVIMLLSCVTSHKTNTVALYKCDPVTKYWKICQYFNEYIVIWLSSIIRVVLYQSGNLLLHVFFSLGFS